MTLGFANAVGREPGPGVIVPLRSVTAASSAGQTSRGHHHWHGRSTRDGNVAPGVFWRYIGDAAVPEIGLGEGDADGPRHGKEAPSEPVGPGRGRLKRSCGGRLKNRHASATTLSTASRWRASAIRSSGPYCCRDRQRSNSAHGGVRLRDSAGTPPRHRGRAGSRDRRRRLTPLSSMKRARTAAGPSEERSYYSAATVAAAADGSEASSPEPDSSMAGSPPSSADCPSTSASAIEAGSTPGVKVWPGAHSGSGSQAVPVRSSPAFGTLIRKYTRRNLTYRPSAGELPRVESSDKRLARL